MYIFSVVYRMGVVGWVEVPLLFFLSYNVFVYTLFDAVLFFLKVIDTRHH